MLSSGKQRLKLLRSLGFILNEILDSLFGIANCSNNVIKMVYNTIGVINECKSNIFSQYLKVFETRTKKRMVKVCGLPSGFFTLVK